MQTKKIFLLITIIALVIPVISARAWVEPTTNPPGNNIFTPLNSSAFGQSKISGLILNLGNATHGLIVKSGLVGIGTDDPQATLDVAGKIKGKGLKINSNSEGVLLPRTTPDKVSNPEEGSLIYNTAESKFSFYTQDDVWESIEDVVTDERKVVEYAVGEGRLDDFYCKKKNITAEGMQEDWTNINNTKICGTNDKICQNGECKELVCGIDLYKTGVTCSPVGTGYYSPATDNNRYACTNKPANSVYTGSGGGANNCPWSCDGGYVKNGESCLILPAKIITTVDSGTRPSIAIGLDGLPRISYTDSAMNLKLARCTNTDCTTKNITTVDSNARYHSSISIGSDGFARISYINHLSYNLKFARCTNEDCSTKNITTLDSTDGTGDYSKVVIGLDGLPRVNYTHYPHDYMDERIRFARCTNADCTTRNITELGVGAATSMDIGQDGSPRVSYFSGAWISGYPNLIFASCTNIDCTTKTTAQVDSISSNPYSFSVAVGSDNLSRIAYQNANYTSGVLKFIRCTNASCSSKNITTVDPNNKGSYFSSMTLGPDGFARISYAFDPSSRDLRFARCTNADCTTKNITTIDSIGDVGAASAIVIGLDGLVRITYVDATNKTIKFVRCNNENCSD